MIPDTSNARDWPFWKLYRWDGLSVGFRVARFAFQLYPTFWTIDAKHRKGGFISLWIGPVCIKWHLSKMKALNE